MIIMTIVVDYNVKKVEVHDKMTKRKKKDIKLTCVRKQIKS